MNAARPIDGRGVDLPWVTTARGYIGLTEIPGKQHHPTILRWLREAKAWWADDETPWCGTFMHAVITETAARWPNLGLNAPPKQWMRALAWSEYAYPTVLAYGAIVTFTRQGGGHVGIAVGRDAAHRPMILGANQRNSVCILPFDPRRIDAVRSPALTHQHIPLPLLDSRGLPLSTNEA